MSGSNDGHGDDFKTMQPSRICSVSKRADAERERNERKR